MSGFSLKDLTKRRLINDMVRFVQPAGKWKIMVVDPISMKLLNHSLKMFDILDENVTLVEMIVKKRQPYPNLEAIYFLSATPEAIQYFIVDFCPGGGKKPLYSAAHLFFIGVLPDDLMHKMTSSGAARYIKNLKELYVDYLPLEQRVFSLDSPASFFRLFSPEAGGFPAQNAEIQLAAKKLTSLLVTLGDMPYIRFYRPADSRNDKSGRFAQALAVSLQHHARIDPGFPPSDTNKSTLIVLDRSIDMNTPLLHEFTYQAMAYDLLPLDDGKYLYAFQNSDGSNAEKEVSLDDEDVLWVQLRHRHIADTTKELLSQFNKFLSENKAASAAIGGSGQNANLKQLKDTLAAMPQFQEMKQKYSIHINLAQECMNMFQRKKLDQAAMVEQNMATGELAEGGKPKNLVSDLVPLLDEPSLTPLDKVRLLMLFIISKDGVQDEDRRKLLQHANISMDLSESITNMALLGVKLSRDGKKEKRVKKEVKKKPAVGESDANYDLSRYVSVVKNVMEDHIAGTLDMEQYPYLGPAPTVDPTVKTGGTSLRTTKPSWQNKKGSTGTTGEVPKGGKIIVFVLGGMTYSEVRSVYEVAAASGKELMIGSTHLMTPIKFVDDLKNLRNPRAFSQYNQEFGFGAGPLPLPDPAERKKPVEPSAASLAKPVNPPPTVEVEKKKKKVFGMF